MLISLSDHFWELATGKVSRGQDGLIAVETKLGLAQPHQLNLHAVFSKRDTWCNGLDRQRLTNDRGSQKMQL